MHPKEEKTLVLLKADAIQRSLIGEIISRFEKVGLKLVATKMVVPSEDLAWKHYNKTDEWFLKKGQNMVDGLKENNLPIEKETIEYGKDILRSVVNYLSCSPVVAMVWEGNQAVHVVKKLVGSTEPKNSDVGTIRGDLTVDCYGAAGVDNRAVRNLIHCTDMPDEAKREIELWFAPNEIINYKLISEEILYNTELNGIMKKS